MSTQTRIKNCIIMPDKRHRLDRNEILKRMMEQDARNSDFLGGAKRRRLRKSTVKKNKQANAP